MLVPRRCYALLLCLLLDTVLAHGSASNTGTSCLGSLSLYQWGCPSPITAECQCSNVNWIGSMVNCVLQNSDDSTQIQELEYILHYCQSANYTLQDIYSINANATLYFRTPSYEDQSTVVESPLYTNQTAFNWYIEKYAETDLAQYRTTWFAWGLFFYWVFIMAIAGAVNLLQKMSSRPILINNAIRRNLILPSILKPDYRERTYMLWNTIPFNFTSRLNALIIVGFIIVTVLFSSVGYCVSSPHPSYTSTWDKNLHQISRRVDLGSLSLFPVVYLFGIRNNPLIPFTGIGFPTFNLYHKWCAYVCACLAFIHVVIYTVIATNGEGYAYWYNQLYWRYGIGAMVVLSLLVVHSEKIFRERLYETFLVCHKLMNIAFIVCMYYHLNTMGWLGWIWSLVAILVYERLMRLVHIIRNGGRQTAILTDCGDDVIRMTVKKNYDVSYQVNSFAYIYFLSPSDFWFYSFQSHPFTVVSAPQQDAENLTFYFKAQKGVTKAMLARVLNSEKKTFICKVLIEGPYGVIQSSNAEPKRRYVGIAAGLGITAVYPNISTLYEHREGQPMKHRLYWVVNNLNSLTWFAKELKWLRENGCSVTILYTGLRESVEDIEDDVAYKKPFQIESISLESDFDIVRLNARPHLRRIVNEEISYSSQGNENLAIINCGPPSFNDAIRSAVRAELLSCQNLKIDVALHEKSFTW